jgi:hypothetical protein
LKVLHFYKTYFPDSFGGIEQFIFQLAHGSAKRGVDVEVLSLSPAVRDAEKRRCIEVLAQMKVERRANEHEGERLSICRVDAGQKKQ